MQKNISKTHSQYSMNITVSQCVRISFSRDTEYEGPFT
jgi:hypothetical protein